MPPLAWGLGIWPPTPDQWMFAVLLLIGVAGTLAHEAGRDGSKGAGHGG